MKQFFKYFTGILPVLAALGIQMVVTFFLSIFYFFYLSFKTGFQMGMEGNNNPADLVDAVLKEIGQSSEAIYFISVMGVLACGIVFFFWYRRLRKGEPKVLLGSVFTTKNTLLIIFLALGCQFFISGGISLLQTIFQDAFLDYSETIDGILSGNPYVVAIFAIVVAPIAEELVFRGVVFAKLRRVTAIWTANIIQAALFGIYHMDLVQGIYAFVLGMILGYMVIKFKTIIASVALHMFVNGSAFIIMAFTPSIITYVLFLVIGGGILYYVLSQIRNAQEPEMAVTVHDQENQGPWDNF